MNAEWPSELRRKKKQSPCLQESIPFSNGHHSTHTHTHTYAGMHGRTYTPSGPIHPSHSNDLKEGDEEERQGGGRLVQQLHQVHPIAKHKHKADHQVDSTDNS